MSLDNSSNKEVYDIPTGNYEVDLERKVDSITKSLSRPHFSKILKELSKTNIDNARIIVDYIFAEQTKLNIRNSTKEGKIKVLYHLAYIPKHLLANSSSCSDQIFLS